MRLDLRCPAKLHGVLIAPDRLEVKCSSRFCGAGNGVVVFHVFDVTTGEVVHDKKYRDPINRRRKG